MFLGQAEQAIATSAFHFLRRCKQRRDNLADEKRQSVGIHLQMKS